MVRKYRLRKRADQTNETRDRIVRATVELHTTIGPSRTSILAIAERAGVERPTVYRHFPTMDELFTACTAHFWAEHPLPDPSEWLQIKDPVARLKRGLGELYSYFAEHELTLWNILRDMEDQPGLRRFAKYALEHREEAHRVLSSGWGKRRRRVLNACVAHAMDFFAWRSLRRQGLNHSEISSAMTAMVAAAARHPRETR